jgi:hypothetical protein
LQGATVLLFSSAHVTGDQLAQMTGVAAILRFSIPDIDEWLEDADETVSPIAVEDTDLSCSKKEQQQTNGVSSNNC